jgi:hypothetical protein
MSYIGQSRSANSEIAREEGKLIYSELKAWQKRAVDAGAVRTCEWHHTGKYFNETNYYDPDSFAELDPADYPSIKKKAPEEKAVTVEYAYWTGSRKHSHRNTDKIAATQRGTWLFGDFADGCKKKQALGNNILKIIEKN